jgi:hypothetical protein
METSWQPDPGSFRDPSGFVFWREGTVYRQVNPSFGAQYRRLMDSGLYDELTHEGLLIRHDEVELRLPDAPPAFAVIRPERLPFISYPYEWCFSQLKAAALLTLEVHRRALGRGLILRDASAYNVQFVGSRPVFIDTLSFGALDDGRPWPAYRQFCQHFLGPLALMSYVHPGLGQLTRVHLDGIPLELVRQILPRSTWLRPGLLMHVHIHGRTSGSTAPGDSGAVSTSRRMTRAALLGLVDSLERTVRGLAWEPSPTLWSTYAGQCNYDVAAQQQKRALVAEFLDVVSGGGEIGTIWDFGANTGEYSQLAAERARQVVSFDLDHAVVDQHFRACVERKDRKTLPLLQDFANPSPPIGWHHAERRSLLQRGPVDVVLALALIHHFALGSNVPLKSIAAFFRDVCGHLIVEFVPKEDSQVQRMLALREDVFPSYTQAAFEEAFNRDFVILRATPIAGTLRTLYLMERR